MELTEEMRLKHFQLALGMVGISANLMTCELIHALGAKVDEKGGDFTLRDATALAESIQRKYQPVQMPPPPGMRPMGEMMSPPSDKMKEMMDKGQVAGFFKEVPEILPD